MPKKKVIKEVKEPHFEAVPKPVTIQPITESFSNGELNILKDKVNEIIARG